jgi:hypothetical protein
MPPIQSSQNHVFGALPWRTLKGDDKTRQPDRQEGGGFHDSVLHDFDLRSQAAPISTSLPPAACGLQPPACSFDLRSPIGQIFVPFLHRFCTMKCNSKLYHTTPGKVPSKLQHIVNESVASGYGFGKRFWVKKR